MSGISRLCKLYLGLVVFSLLGTLLTKRTGLDAGPIAPAASLLTLCAGFLATLEVIAEAIGSRRAWTAAGIVLVLGATFEIFSLYTGLPGGKYGYTQVWWPTIHLPGGELFPLQLPFAWFLVSAIPFLLAVRFFTPVVAAFVGGLLAAMVDLVMEPIMTGPLNYWHWKQVDWPIGAMPGGVSPIMNSVGWFLTATLAALVLARFGAEKAAASHQPQTVFEAHLALVCGMGAIHNQGIFQFLFLLVLFLWIADLNSMRRKLRRMLDSKPL